MQLELIDTDVLPETDDLHGQGICLVMRGEQGDKHPNLCLVLDEGRMPNLRWVWERGRRAEFLATFHAAIERGEVADPDQLWEHLLSIDSEQGRHCRMIESGCSAVAE